MSISDIEKKIKNEILQKSINKARKNKLSSDEAVDESFHEVLQTKYSFNINNVYVKESNIHGFGVFTNKSISKDEVLTIYPCDLLQTSVEQFIPENYIGYGYCYPIHDDYVVFGDSKKCSSDYCGHLINDFSNNSNGYDWDSNGYNCNFKSLYGIILIIATRDINPNEELFIPYGPKYWDDWWQESKNHSP